MHPPIGKFSRLSLNVQGMAPVTRSQSQHVGGHLNETSAVEPDIVATAEHRNLDRSDGDDDDEDEEDDVGPVRSPLTDLFYSVDNLDDETEELVRELFRQPAPEETPPLVIEWCGISNDPDVYAFQLQEIVPRTIRIGSPTSRIPKPSCNCTGAENKPCRHLVWLMDQIAKQTLHAHHPDKLLVLEGNGSPRELDNIYSRVADFHIDVLANALHCRAGPPNGRLNLHRVREVREILAGLAGIRDDVDVDAYAPEIFDVERTALQDLLWGHRRQSSTDDGEEGGAEREGEEETEENSDDGEQASAGFDHGLPATEESQGQDLQPEGSGDRHGGVRSIIERGDLQRTILRLLVWNDEFFGMFLRLLAPSDKARDPFRKIQQRVELVLDALLSLRPEGQPAGIPVAESSETVSVAWAARHVQNAVQQIRLLLDQRTLSGSEKRLARPSAGRALVWIFNALVFQHNRDAHAGPTQDDRNLYQRLIGNNEGQGGGGGGGGGQEEGEDGGTGFFLLDELQSLHDQVQFRASLERIRRRIQVNGYREPYMRKLDAVLAQMRSTTRKADSPVRRPHSRDASESSTSGSGGVGGSSSISPAQVISRRAVGEPSGGRRSRGAAVVPSTAGSKRQGSNTGIPSDRGPKRMR